MPVVWSGVLDLVDQIWSKFGFFFLLLWLQRMEEGVGRKATVSLNKVRMDCHLEFWFLVFKSLPADRGGEGRRCLGEEIRASSRWRGVHLLQSEVHHMVAKLASMISGRRGGHFKRCIGSVLPTSMVEALQDDSGWSFASTCCQVVCPRQREDDRHWSHAVGGEDQGLDCFSFSVSRVLYVKLQDYFLFSMFKGPACNMYPPLVN